MAEAQYAVNHTIDPETGYLESKAYPFAFDAQRKKQFITCLVENGLGIYEACEAMKLSHHSLFKHYHNDPIFKEDLDAARHEYGSRLDALSKKNAMNPKSVIERIFQLKSIFPDKYADQKHPSSPQITINIDTTSLQNVSKRQEVLEAEIVKESSQALAKLSVSENKP